MEYRSLGNISEVSRLALGGGGIGQVWGETDQDEAVATVRHAWDAGINLFDMAPLYGNGEAESVMGLAFGNSYPDGLRVTTKCMLGNAPANEIESRLVSSLDKSSERMRRAFIDIFILHGYVVADDLLASDRGQRLAAVGVPESTFFESVVPVFESLKASGRIGAWGVTAASTQPQNFAVLGHDVKPDVAQCITNLLDSPGGMAITGEPADPRKVISKAVSQGVGVMGIRAVAAGSLTDAIDREVPEKSAEYRDFARAAAFRGLAADMGEEPAFLAHQYALSMPGVDTVVLGVKNREELDECLRAQAAGPLSAELMSRIDGSVIA